MSCKKLIEVALPLEKINSASAKEKSIRFGHPSTLHLWWARRPLAAARAVIWSSLVDDPSSHPELFPTEEEQNQERRRLFDILENLVVWENSNDEAILRIARNEILKYTNNNPPALLDPFAGGGAIPFEAQRLGLEAHAHDLNPVAVMINKAMIEIPPRFADLKSVNPDSQRLNLPVKASHGLAEDVRYYGEWMRNEAEQRIGHLYPKVELPASRGGGNAKVIAWLWARITKCPNPACGCDMPLVSSYVLSKKKGFEAWVEPCPIAGKVRFTVHEGICPKDKESPKISRNAIFKCPACGEVTTDDYVKKQGKKGAIRTQLMATVAERQNTRIYISPDDYQELVAQVDMPQDYPSGEMSLNPRWFSPPSFGMTDFADLFTPRQMVALTTFSKLAVEVQKIIEEDGIKAGLSNDHISLADGGHGALAYAQAVGVYLTFGVSRMADIDNALCPWEPVKTQVRHLFGRQAIPMLWDFGENNVFNDAAGDFRTSLGSIIRVIDKFAVEKSTPIGVTKQQDAQSDCGLRNVMVSTDPPYYDNIGYADLSDFFYLWLRNGLKTTYPRLFSTMLVPKAEELIAVSFRHGGDVKEAKKFFEDGMLSACRQLYKYSTDDIPLTVYYAYKQSDSSTPAEGQASTGWETMLSAIINSGFMITGTWPMRTELITGLKGSINALASSIVLVCRKRKNDATICTRRQFVNELKRELRPAVQKLQISNIAPVDLAQSAIGPGMGVFSKYSQVMDADGSPMTVRGALQIINQELDLYFNEQDGELDTESRFCIDMYSQVAFNEMSFGDANTLATAKNTSVAIMASHGTLYAQKGKARLVERPELPTNINEHEGSIWLLCQQLTYKMEKEGIEGCATVIANMYGSNAEHAKDLAYRLYTIAEKKKWAQEAYAYNALVVAWPEIQSRAAELKAITPQQLTIDDMLN